MAILRAIATAPRFSIVVILPSCAQQWEIEFGGYFAPVCLQDYVPTVFDADQIAYRGRSKSST